METATQETLLRQEEGLQKRLGWIWICGSAAAFLGLLGTLAGLAGALKLSGADGESQALLTGGIAEALVATQVGLAVGALCLVLRGILGELAESVRTILHSAALSVLSLPLSSGEEVPHPGVGARV
jgi:biopolymer transport protein ExbB/TolQ